MRNTILTLVSAGSLTLTVLTPALATGVCADYPDLRNCPIYGISENSPSLQLPSKHIRHARSVGYHHHG
jgi:hypothetical protein